MDDQLNQAQPKDPTLGQPGDTPPSAAPVMDVRRPEPMTPPPSVAVEDVSMSAEGSIAGPTTPTEATNSVSTPDASPHLPSPPGSDATPEHSLTPAIGHMPQKGSGKAIKVILIIVIALALIGGAVYFYLKNRDEAQTQTNTTTSQTTTTQVAPATAKDVDQTTQDIDTAIKQIDETKDVSSDDLTDSSLSL